MARKNNFILNALQRKREADGGVVSSIEVDESAY